MKRLYAMRPSKRKLFLEAYLWLGWARLLKSLPFARVAPTLGVPMLETPLSHDPHNDLALRNVSDALITMSRHTFWESKCLVMAIAALKMLERRGIDSTLYLGIARDTSGKMIAHAWLRSGPYYITGFEGMERFTVVGKFGKQLMLNRQGRR